MTREEHLTWCKERAAAYLDEGNVIDAWGSFYSDMSKHPGTQNHPALILGIALVGSNPPPSVEAMRKHIDGYN